MNKEELVKTKTISHPEWCQLVRDGKTESQLTDGCGEYSQRIEDFTDHGYTPYEYVWATKIKGIDKDGVKAYCPDYRFAIIMERA